jgi:hypothetical protein
MKLRLGWGIVLAGALWAGSAAAVPFGFSCITGNSAGNCSAGEAQLSVDVTDLGGGQVLFQFSNAGPAASTIADVYFDDDGSFAGIAGLVDADDDALGALGDPGVDFSPGGAPPDLPGGDAVGFAVTAGLLADAEPPVPANGVNPGETLGIVLDLQTGGSFAGVIAGLGSGAIRVGIHVQAFDSGGSESFVSVVPEPGTALLTGLGLALLGLRRRI